jgi:hypothetical protein
VIAVFPSQLRGLGGRIGKPRRRLLVFVALLALVVAGVLWVRSRASFTSTERKLVGSWIMADSPGTTRVITFASDRRVTARLVDRSGATVGEILGDKDEIWYVDGQNVFIRRGPKAVRSLFDLVPGHNQIWERWPIRSLTDDTLVIGEKIPSQDIVLKRTADR